MDKLMDVINYFKTIDLKQVIDILIAIAVIIFFYIFSSGLSYILIRIFKRKKTDKERIKKMPFYKPLKIFFIVLGIFLATRVLQIQGKAMDIIELILNERNIYMNDLISVIVSVYNDEKNLRDCIISLIGIYIYKKINKRKLSYHL